MLSDFFRSFCGLFDCQIVHFVPLISVIWVYLLQLCILLFVPFAFVHRILLVVLLQFRLDDFIDVQIQIAGHHVGVDQHIGEFPLDPLQIVCCRFLRIFPLEQLQQFSGLQAYRDGKILLVMELAPVTVIAEFIDFVHCVHVCHPFLASFSACCSSSSTAKRYKPLTPLVSNTFSSFFSNVSEKYSLLPSFRLLFWVAFLFLLS